MNSLYIVLQLVIEIYGWIVIAYVVVGLLMAFGVVNVYNRADPLFERGEGSWLFTRAGDAYLDCVGGIATNALGHAHPALVAALTGQAQKLWHISNMFRVEGQDLLAKVGFKPAESVLGVSESAEEFGLATAIGVRPRQEVVSQLVRGDDGVARRESDAEEHYARSA